MPLGREVGLSPSDIVLDGDPAPLPPNDIDPNGDNQISTTVLSSYGAPLP